MKDKTENESFDMFKDKVPKNEFEWEGSVVLYDAGHDTLATSFFSGEASGPTGTSEGSS